MVTFAYNPETQTKAMKEFFEALPFVLPCKYCRSNLVEHYEIHPIEDALRSQPALTRWLYEIHNLVNAKLRSQGMTVEADPPFDVVQTHYKERLAYGCSKTFFPGWEFLFSVVESHPLRKDEQPHPLPNAPPLESIRPSDKLTRLRWNTLSKQHRYEEVCKFWRLLPSVLPFEEWRTLWKKTGQAKFPSTKDAAFRSLWKTRKEFEEELELLNKTTYHDLCKMIRFYKSGCASSKNANTRTCRRLRNATRKQNRK
jgi:hypothetical protein